MNKIKKQKIPCYVINLKRRKDKKDFYIQENINHLNNKNIDFVFIEALDALNLEEKEEKNKIKKLLSSLNPSLLKTKTNINTSSKTINISSKEVELDNINKDFTVYDCFDDKELFKKFTINNRDIISKTEICCTLSHFLCFLEILKNKNIKDDEYCLISEDDILFNTDFKERLDFIYYSINSKEISYKQKDLILLCKNDYNNKIWQNRSDDVIFKDKDLVFMSHENPLFFNNEGSGLYFIRKRLVKEIFKKLRQENKKIHWLADWFCEYCHQDKILITYPLICQFRKHHKEMSDIENDRHNNIKFYKE